MQVDDLKHQSSIRVEAGTPVITAAQQLSQAGVEYAPVFSDRNFIGLFVPGDNWVPLIDPEDCDKPVETFVLSDLPAIPFNAMSVEAVLEASGRFLVVLSNIGEFVGCIDKDKISLQQQEAVRATTAAQLIINSLAVGLVAIDMDSVIVQVNGAALEMLGMKRKNLMGLPISKAIPESQLGEVLKTRTSQVVKVTVNDNSFFAVQSLVTSKSEPLGAVSVFQNISQLESITAELEAMKDLAAEYSAIFENSYDGIYITDGEGKTLRINQAYERITGLKIDNLLGRNMKEIVENGFLDESVTFKIKESKVPMTIAQKLKGGKEILVSGTPVFNDKGELHRVISNVRDMTELNSFRNQLKETKMLASQYAYELEELRANQWVRTQLIFKSKKMEETIELALRVAKVDSTVLIKGESGAGKEIIANIIHRHSHRAEAGSFIKINCGAIPGPLLESELFGYEEGAFTGAKRGGKPGMFELANNGTLFLDEIGDLPHELQVKLLRALQFGEITRVGGIKPMKVDIRLITATSKKLKELLKSGEFRNDLYYRLNVVPITTPALRERQDDILPIAQFYLDRFNKQYNYEKSFSREAMEILTRHRWPGNIRELINLVERLVVTTRGDIISMNDLPQSILPEDDLNSFMEQQTKDSLKEILDAVEKQVLVNAFQEHGSSRKVAKALKISQSSVIRRATKHNVGFNKQWDAKESGLIADHRP